MGNNKGYCAERSFDGCAGKLSIDDNKGGVVLGKWRLSMDNLAYKLSGRNVACCS